MKSQFDIREDDLSSDQTRDLLAFHLSGMRKNSPSDAVSALDFSGLLAREVTVWSAWAGRNLAGIGALKLLGNAAAEVKSMRTHPDFLRMGAAAEILEHIIVCARKSGVSRLSLETGSGAAFEPALALYRRRGFINGKAFSGYIDNAFSQFLHLAL